MHLELYIPFYQYDIIPAIIFPFLGHFRHLGGTDMVLTALNYTVKVETQKASSQKSSVEKFKKLKAKTIE